MSEATANEVGFEINGERYEVPTLDTITLDEERVLYLYADTVLQDFAPAHPDESNDVKRALQVRQEQRVRNPDFKRALVHIAYRRRHPEVSDAEINQAIGTANALEVDIALLRGDGSPPAMSSQKPPDDKRSTSEPSPPSSSGSPTANGSETVAESLAPTGATESDTSSRGAAQIASVT